MTALVLVLLLQAQGKPALPEDKSVLVRVADGAKLPCLALDADGNAYVAFVRNGNIELSLSTDGGKTFSAPVVALNALGRDPAIPNRGPRVAVDRQKRIYVSAPLCLAPPNAPVINDLYVAVSTDRGKTFSKPYPVNEGPGSAPESVHASAAGAGDFHAAWVSSKDQKSHTLSYARFSDQGKRNGKTVTITAFCCENCPPALAVDALGNPILVWREGSKDPAGKTSRQIFLSRSTDGGKTFAPAVQLNSVDSGLADCPQDPPAAACSPDGKLLAAAWMDRRDLEHDANVYWAFGPPGKFARDTDVHDDRRFIQRRPSLAVDAEGVVWCAWEDGRLSTQRVFYTSSRNPANIPLGDAKEGGGHSPSLAANGGKVAVAYQIENAVGFRILPPP